jgi:phosphoribosylformylglycinamidine cyclo-ligase
MDLLRGDHLDYRSAGVDTALGQAFVKEITQRLGRLNSSGVLQGIGGFAGLFELPTGFREPVLVAGTDGVGTKLKVAQACNQSTGVGIDLVAMCVNDILTTGAKPLFFLDYIATGKLDPNQLLQVIDGIIQGCEQAGCALLGGETAEMPGFYQPQEYDLAGFCVGIVEKSAILGQNRVEVGDRLLALPSSGVHSNGYSLVRRIISEKELTWNHRPSGWNRSLGEVFLTPTRIYVHEILEALRAGVTIHSMAHITGGGLPENLPRSLKSDQSAQLYPQRWPVPQEFVWLQHQGKVSTINMFHTFNLGLGMILTVPQDQVAQAKSLLPDLMEIGEVIPGSGEVLGLWEDNL